MTIAQQYILAAQLYENRAARDEMLASAKRTLQEAKELLHA